MSNDRVTVRLNAAEFRQLAELAGEMGMSLSEAVRSCVAARFRYEDLAAEVRALRSDVSDSRANSERVTRAEADRILKWLSAHVQG